VRVVISLTGVAAVTFVAYRLIPVNATTVGFGYPRPPSCATHFFGSLPKYQDGVSVQCFFYEVVCSGIFFRLDVGRNLQHGCVSCRVGNRRWCSLLSAFQTMSADLPMPFFSTSSLGSQHVIVFIVRIPDDSDQHSCLIAITVPV